MKINVITLHTIKNYGSVLQALATQELLQRHGADVEIINFVREDVLPENIIKTYAGKNLIKRIIMYPTVLKWKAVFDRFIHDNLNISKKTYTHDCDFESFDINQADAYCTGSDQVWNSKWNKGIIKSMYLNFVPSNKYRFSFSSSFGQDRLTDGEVENTKQYINQYNRISVREASAKTIIEKQYKYENPVQLLDPTLCLPGDFWRKFKSDRIIKEEYILIYNLNRSKEFDNYAKELSKITGQKLVRLCTRYDQVLRPGYSVLVPSIEEFITLIDDARFVLTDSFHATAFSLNMNTEPICVYPKEFGGRIDSFLKLVSQEQRRSLGFDDFDVINRETDFEKVNSILESERNRANHYLDDVIADINNRMV